MNAHHQPRTPIVRTAMLLALGLAAVVPAVQAIDGRDFAGRYQTANEVESGEDVFLTFETELFNYSGGEILGATVRLENPFGAEEPYASWLEVNLPADDRVRLVTEATIPLREHDAWRQGAMPRLTVEWQDAEGLTRRMPVELMRDRLPEQGDPS